MPGRCRSSIEHGTHRPPRRDAGRGTRGAGQVGSEYVDEEERFRSVARTDSGRWLLVVSTDRGEKTRVITAYDASKRHIELYLTSKRR